MLSEELDEGKQSEAKTEENILSYKARRKRSHNMKASNTLNDTKNTRDGLKSKQIGAPIRITWNQELYLIAKLSRRYLLGTTVCGTS